MASGNREAGKLSPTWGSFGGCSLYYQPRFWLLACPSKMNAELEALVSSCLDPLAPRSPILGELDHPCFNCVLFARYPLSGDDLGT